MLITFTDYTKEWTDFKKLLCSLIARTCLKPTVSWIARKENKAMVQRHCFRWGCSWLHSEKGSVTAPLKGKCLGLPTVGKLTTIWVQRTASSPGLESFYATRRSWKQPVWAADVCVEARRLPLHIYTCVVKRLYSLTFKILTYL